MNKEKKIPGHILSLFIILLSISGVCLLMYKAQFRFNLHQPIEYVMMTTHKPTGTITLSSDSPVLTETFRIEEGVSKCSPKWLLGCQVLKVLHEIASRNNTSA